LGCTRPPCAFGITLQVKRASGAGQGALWVAVVLAGMLAGLIPRLRARRLWLADGFSPRSALTMIRSLLPVESLATIGLAAAVEPSVENRDRSQP